MPHLKIVGTGHHVPPHIVTNHELAAKLDTSDEWIQQRTGIKTRHLVSEATPTSELAYRASLRALEMANLSATDIDCILFATLSPDVNFPGSGVFLQRALGISNRLIPAFDIRNQCSGFLYSFVVADAFIRSGLYRTILIVGAEIHSTGLDWSNRGRDVSVIFGDGAGAVVVTATDQNGSGVLASSLHAQGEFAELLWTENPASRNYPLRFSTAMINHPTIFPQMDGKAVFRHAVQRLPEAVRESLEKAELRVADIDHWIFHQANIRINQLVGRSLGIDPARIYHNIEKYGNLSAGSIPTLLDETVRDSRIARGDLVCLAGFGSGFTWGSIILRW